MSFHTKGKKKHLHMEWACLQNCRGKLIKSSVPRYSPLPVSPNADAVGWMGKCTILNIEPSLWTPSLFRMPTEPALFSFCVTACGGISVVRLVSVPQTYDCHKHLPLTHSERRLQNIYSQEEMNLYCIIKLATEISLFLLQISQTWRFG